MTDEHPTEAATTNRILKGLNAIDGAFFWKTHGSAFGKRGISDLIGVYKTLPVAIEVKRSLRLMHSGVTPLQQKFLDDFAEAGGLTVVACDETTVEVIVAAFEDALTKRCMALILADRLHNRTVQPNMDDCGNPDCPVCKKGEKTLSPDGRIDDEILN